MSPEASLNLETLYSSIEDEIRRLEIFIEKEFSAEEPFILRLFEHIRNFRGKQIRPALLLMVAKQGGGFVTEDHIKIAAVVELIHTATLVHDDILDDARLRRNVETLHLHWGERVAVLMGDFIYSRAFALSTEVPGMAQVLSRTTNTICEGELLQIRTRFKPDIREEVYLEIIRKKTAILHAVACDLGARLAELHPSECDRLYNFGLDLGMAFQIIDDCIDYAGDEAVAGKSLGTDLHQGKLTLPLIYLFRLLPEKERVRLIDRLRAPMSAATEAEVASRVRESGALKAAFERAEEYVSTAKTSLSGLPASLGEGLDQLADYVIRRRH